MNKNYVVGALFLLLFVSSGLKSQNNSAPAANNPKLKEQAIKAREQSLQKKNTDSSAPKSTLPAVVLDENDPYQGRKAEFLNNLTVSELPSDFPKYDKSLGIRGYNQMVDNYYINHLNILKPAVKAKFLGK